MAGFTVSADIKDIDKFQEILSVMRDFISDDRIPSEVQQEFKDKMLSITKSKES